MTNHPCPLCHQPGRLLDVGGNSLFAYAVEYYRCDPCGHVWSHRKDEPNAAPVDVTQPDPDRHAS